MQWITANPFADECVGAEPTTTVQIGAAIAHYSIPEYGLPALWWGNGAASYTLAGPYSAEQLASVARSLVEVG